ncbi:MAG: two-component system sensor histidine kinase HydH [Myxococcota bacterium]
MLAQFLDSLERIGRACTLNWTIFMKTPSIGVQRTALWVIGVVAAGALVVTTLTSYSSVEAASKLLVRGQAGALSEAIIAQVRVAQRTAVDDVETSVQETLDELLADLSESGLRYVAVAGPGGDIIATAGDSALGKPRFPRRMPPGRKLSEVGERIRVMYAPPGSRARPRPHHRRRQPPPRLVFEFEPQLRDSMRAEARWNLVAGGAGALLLLLASFVLGGLVARSARANKRLAEKQELERLGAMSAVLAHEMRNPLAAIKGNLQLLVERFRERPEDQKKVSKVLDETVRLEGLTQSLLTFVRSGALEPANTAPVAIVESAIAQVTPGSLAGRVIVDKTRAPALWRLDGPRLERALANVIQNALQASPPQGSVTVGISVEANRLVIMVSDAGPGFSDEVLPRLFEPFATTRLQGTGLGLAVAKRVVEAHGGEISAGNRIVGPTGAIVTMSFPAGGA